MTSTHRLVASLAVFGFISQSPAGLADGICTERPPTAAEKKSYGDAYALFLRAAPAAPDGWTASDQPANASMPALRSPRSST